MQFLRTNEPVNVPEMVHNSLAIIDFNHQIIEQFGGNFSVKSDKLEYNITALKFTDLHVISVQFLYVQYRQYLQCRWQ